MSGVPTNVAVAVLPQASVRDTGTNVFEVSARHDIGDILSPGIVILGRSIVKTYSHFSTESAQSV